MTEDTKAILAALDRAHDAVARRGEDRMREAEAIEQVSVAPAMHEAARLDLAAAATLRALRSRIEKERPFLEAAMALARYKLGYGGDGSLRTSEFVRTYAALTEKPPAIDEGEASRGGCQCGCEKPPEEGGNNV